MKAASSDVKNFKAPVSVGASPGPGIQGMPPVMVRAYERVPA
jgi:hypothetical protein